MKPSFFLLLLPCALVARRADASAMLKPTSGVSVALSPKSLALDARLSGAFASTTVTTVYANPNSEQIEADFIYSAPKGSVVTGFAYWYRGEKVVARVVEKARAAKIYQYITSRMRDPALIEMIGPNRFRARIFPVEAHTDLKIEVQLAQKLDQTPSGPAWTWPLREETKAASLAQLSVHVQSEAAFSSNLGAAKNGELNFERKSFRATGNARVLVPQPNAPLRASLIGARDGGAEGFFALSLSSSVPVASPRLQISGVKTFDVLVPTVRRLGANTAFVVLGRYRGSGQARVTLNGRQVAVRFPDARQSRNLPELLWASARMESLSADAKNQAQVTALSQRFGMPSKWTSWLAIPEEERRNFKRQMMASDRADAARAYAQAVSRGDANAAKAQKLVVDDLTKQIKALGSNYAEDEELQPLDSYLNDELRRLQSAVLQAKYDPKISKSKSAQWANWAKNLERAGATSGGKGVDLPVYVMEDELRIASRLYLIEVEAGRKNGAQAKRMQARLKELAGTKTAKQYDWDETSFIDEQAEARANALSMEIATSRASDKPNRQAERQAQARLARLNGVGDVDAKEALQGALQQVWGQKIEVAANGWAKEIEANRAGSDVARRYAREVRAIQARSGLKDIPQVSEAWFELATLTGLKASDAIRDEGPNGVAARELDAHIAAMETRSGQRQLRDAAWGEITRKIASQLEDRLIADQDATPAVRALQLQLEAIGAARKIDTPSHIRSAWSRLANHISSKLADEVRAGRENEPAAQVLEQRLALARQKSNDTGTNWALRQAWNERARDVAAKVVTKALEENQLAPDDDLVAQGKTLVEKSGQGSFDQLLVPAANEQLTKLNAQIADEIAAKRENAPKAVQLRGQIEQLQKLFPGAKTQRYLGYYNYRQGETDEQFAWEGRAHEAAYRLLDAQKKAPANTEQLKALQSELAQSAKSAGKRADDVLKWEGTRLAKNEPLLSASDYRLRPGDPLISVVAPATCKAVLALMPDGTLLPLAWNDKTKSFEARFDVPAFAPEGDYQVRIILVGEDGNRRVLSMRFAVDLKSPQGNGAVRRAKDVWHLSLRSDDQTERVSAFTPWNVRVELNRNENDLFVGDAPVPTTWTQDAGVTRFVVTDKAHNRTEISLDSH